MDITSLSGLLPATRVQQNLNKTTDRIQTAIASLVSGQRFNAENVASLALATQLQSENTTLRSAVSNLAQASSLLEVADGGIEQIGNILLRMQTLAAQSNSGALNDATRKNLNGEFQQLAAEIDRLSTSTQFGGKPLLDGSLSGENALTIDGILVVEDTEGEALSRLSIGSLSSSALFEGADLNLLSQGNSANALTVVGNAMSQLITARVNVGSFQSQVNFISANLESAIANQEAARSTLNDTDFASAATDLAQLLLQREAGIAVAAQGNRLAPSLLQLIA